MSAVFAALTAPVSEIGLEGVDSDFATLIRTCVITVTLRGSHMSRGTGATPSHSARRLGAFRRYQGWPLGRRGSARFPRCRRAMSRWSPPWTHEASCRSLSLPLCFSTSVRRCRRGWESSWLVSVSSSLGSSDERPRVRRCTAAVRPPALAGAHLKEEAAQ
jgi:hypothetical protein